jgi:Tfp pilus assembly protein PilF
MAGQRAEARAAFEEALARNPGLARAHSSLAFLAAEDGRSDEALERCRKAVALDPKEWPKVLALGSLLWQKGRYAEARSYLELFAAEAPPVYAREIDRVKGWLSR